jgi:hypothetical protein
MLFIDNTYKWRGADPNVFSLLGGVHLIFSYSTLA